MARRESRNALPGRDVRSIATEVAQRVRAGFTPPVTNDQMQTSGGAPGVPQNIVATNGFSEIRFDWDPLLLADLWYYEVEISAPPDDYPASADVVTVRKSYQPWFLLLREDVESAAGYYEAPSVRVRAVNSSGLFSDWSPYASGEFRAIGSFMPAGSAATTDYVDGSIVEDDLADFQVTTDKIADGAVTTDKLADDAVTTDKIVDLTILNDDIADATLGLEKLAPLGSLNRIIITDGVGEIQAHGALTASRLLSTDADGLPQVNASLTTNRLAYASASGTLASNAALTQNRVVIGDANGLPTPAAAITASRALISDANGVPTHSTVSSTELGYLDNVTFDLQTQLDIATVGIFGYRFDSSTTMADPGTSEFRINHASLFSAATAIAISDTDLRGIDRDGQLDSLTGFYLDIVQSNNPLVRARFKITTPTDNGSWHELTVTYVDGVNPPFSNGANCTIRIFTAIQVADTALTVTDSSSIDFTLAGNDITAVVKPDGITAAMLAAQAGAQARIGSVGGLATAIASTSYANCCSVDADLLAGSRVLVLATAYHLHVSGTTTYTLRRGTTVIADEPAYIFSNNVIVFAAEDSPGAGTVTYHLSVKNTTPAGTHSYARICYVEVR